MPIAAIAYLARWPGRPCLTSSPSRMEAHCEHSLRSAARWAGAGHPARGPVLHYARGLHTGPRAPDRGLAGRERRYGARHPRHPTEPRPSRFRPSRMAAFCAFRPSIVWSSGEPPVGLLAIAPHGTQRRTLQSPASGFRWHLSQFMASANGSAGRAWGRQRRSHLAMKQLRSLRRSHNAAASALEGS